MPKAEVTLPAAISSVPTARHFVESILSAWGLSALSWNSILIVSELAANAALHAHGESLSIRVQADEGSVRLEVVDSSVRLPQQRSYSNDATTGRGLRLVGELSSEWGVDPTDAGKTVWAVLRASDNAIPLDDEVDVDALLDAFDDDGSGDVVQISDARRRPSAHAVMAA
jgi:anti-sigma regulatory factor (Ser/Thr protein kinase)